MASASNGTVKRKTTKKAPAKPRTKKAAAPKIELPVPSVLDSADEPSIDTPTDTPNPGVESGGEWMPPADTSKVAALPQITGAAPAPDKTWSVGEVKTALLAISGTVDIVGGQAVGAQLTMTAQEVDTLAPPLTNIINRSPRLRAMGSASDAVLVIMGLGGYGVRVGGEAMETKRQRAEDAKRAAAAEQADWSAEAIDA
jgi:hypothetical protein